MGATRMLLAVALLAPCAAAQSAPSIPLQSGAAQSFALPPGAFTNSYYIDVAEADQSLAIEVESSTSNVDLDLLLRYGSPIPDSVDGVAPEASYLIEYAQYFSQSPDDNERLVIGRSNRFPLRAGRWFITVLNFSNVAANATLKGELATSVPPRIPIEVVFTDTSNGCDVAPWNDASPRTPIGGNSGTTLGAQRRNAMLRAAEILGNEIRSPVLVRVQACWQDLPGDANSATLAQAGPYDLIANDRPPLRVVDGLTLAGIAPFLQRNYTVYAAAAAGKQAGTRVCGIVGFDCAESYEIIATFNTKIDTADALGDRGFYYGSTPDTCTGNCDSDFVSTAMHEMTHGLGFIGLINRDPDEGVVGAKLTRYDDAYTANVVAVTGDGVGTPFNVRRFSAISDADRGAALVSQSGLRWDGPEALVAQTNPLRTLDPPNNYPRLYAPDPVQPGSSLGHLTASGNTLMLPTIINGIRTMGLALPMARNFGWSETAAVVAAPFLPRSTIYFDPARDGHGIGFTRIVDNLYFLAFYTYDANGLPEWYVAIGPVIDGVFTPASNGNGDSLVRYKYFPNQQPRQRADAAFDGQVRLDFNQAEVSPACNDGVGRDRSSPLAVMTWSLGADLDQQWCMQTATTTAQRGNPEYTGLWNAGDADSGWGYSVLTFNGGSGNSLFSLLYYPDSNGDGRWSYIASSNFSNGQTITLKQRRGYCRTCAKPASFVDVDAGTINLTINAPNGTPGNGNGATFTASYQNPPGSSFARTNAPFLLLSIID